MGTPSPISTQGERKYDFSHDIPCIRPYKSDGPDAHWTAVLPGQEPVTTGAVVRGDPPGGGHGNQRSAHF